MTQKPPHDSHDAAHDPAWQRDVREGILSKRQNLLMEAAARGQLTRLAFIHAHDNTVCRDQSVMNAALHAASCAGHHACVKWLLTHGSDAAHNRSRCLIGAINANSGDSVDLLLRHGADIKEAQKATYPTSLLARAVEERKPEAAKALLLHGCDPFSYAPSGKQVTSRIRDLGMPILTEIINRLWLKDVARVPADFAATAPLDDLQRAWPTHGGLTGIQLCVYNGQLDALLARLTAQGRKLCKSDLITATPKHPQTILFIAGQRGELARIFRPALWGHDVAGMREALTYVPAAFRHQIDTATFTTIERQRAIAHRAAREAGKLRLPKPPRP